ncbi:hypothetical protein CPB86DRAFT_691147, partial [Serendipita vermifera]
VSFCLKYLEENSGATLVLHTLPLEKGQVIDDKVDEDGPPRKRRKLASSVEDIPRLISVVEIVKREYSKSSSKSLHGTSPLKPALHQYNLLGCLSTTEKNGQQDELLVALDGKNYVQRAATPYMKIYLSTRIQEDLKKEGATRQDPLAPPKQSKSACAREKKRFAKS